MDNYEVLDGIGKGNFGSISKILRKTDNKILVWKEGDYGKMTEKEKQNIVSEVNILREGKHPNIVRYYDRIIDKKNTKIYIVMEYCEAGDLGQGIKRLKKSKDYIPEEVIWKIFTQLCFAGLECHNHKEGKIGHRDIKPSNVFLDGENNVKGGDFGLSRILSNESYFAYSQVGTPYYMSPEQIEEVRYNDKSDIWSLGCCLYELTTFAPPFEASNQLSLALKIKAGKIDNIPSKYSQDLNCLIKALLCIDHTKRPSIDDLVKCGPMVIKIKERKGREHYGKGKKMEEVIKEKEESLNVREKNVLVKEKENLENEEKLKEFEKKLMKKQQELDMKERELVLKESEINNNNNNNNSSNNNKGSPGKGQVEEGNNNNNNNNQQGNAGHSESSIRRINDENNNNNSYGIPKDGNTQSRDSYNINSNHIITSERNSTDMMSYLYNDNINSNCSNNAINPANCNKIINIHNTTEITRVKNNSELAHDINNHQPQVIHYSQFQQQNNSTKPQYLNNLETKIMSKATGKQNINGNYIITNSNSNSNSNTNPSGAPYTNISERHNTNYYYTNPNGNIGGGIGTIGSARDNSHIHQMNSNTSGIGKGNSTINNVKNNIQASVKIKKTMQGNTTIK